MLARVFSGSALCMRREKSSNFGDFASIAVSTNMVKNTPIKSASTKIIALSINISVLLKINNYRLNNGNAERVPALLRKYILISEPQKKFFLNILIL